MTDKTLPQAAPVRPTSARHHRAFKLHMLRHFFRVSSALLPGLTARLVYRLWFRTTRFNWPQRERAYARKSAFHRLRVNTEQIRVYSWGSGPVVLLMHGWNGRGTQPGALIGPLTQQGYRVVSFDAPGHGHSTGRHSTLFHFSDSARRVAELFGPVDTIISHSFGAPAAVHAVHTGLGCNRLIMISPPASLAGLFDRFARAMRINENVRQRFRRLFETDYGQHIWETGSTEAGVKGLRLKGLIIHDQHDLDIPVEEAQQIHRNWPGSELYITHNLGHRRILRDAAVIDKVLAFLGRA